MKISGRIREARDEKGYSQTDLATRIGVTQPTVSDWENGRTEPTVDNLRLLAEVFEVNFEWIATGRGEREYIPGVKESRSEYRVSVELPADEVDLLGRYRALTKARKNALLAFLRAWK